MRSSSAFSLGDLGSASSRSVPKIIEQSKKGKLDVGVAAKVLGQIGDKSALPYVNTLKPVKFYDQDLIDTAKQQLQGGR